MHLNDQGNIQIETQMSGIDGIMGTISRKLVDLQNEAVRQGLIALGWTPPAGHPLVSPKATPGIGRAAQVQALAYSLVPIDQGVLCDALARVGWHKLGRGVWMEPEKA